MAEIKLGGGNDEANRAVKRRASSDQVDVEDYRKGLLKEVYLKGS